MWIVGEGCRDLRRRRRRSRRRGDVALEGAAVAGLAEVFDEFFGFSLQALGLVAEDEGGAGCGELFGDGVGDAALVGEAEDDGDFALHIDHVLLVRVDSSLRTES